MTISSNSWAIVAMIFGVATAAAALVGALQANRETNAAVEQAKADASVKINAAHDEAEIKIADAKSQAARANERAAMLEKEAADAKLQLAQVKSGVSARRVTKAQKAVIVKALRGKSTAAFIVLGTEGDAETEFYAAQLDDALTAAGMQRKVGAVSAEGIGWVTGPGNPILLYVPPSAMGGTTQSDPVYLALSAALGPLSLASGVFDGGKRTHPDYYFVQIGRRSAPTLK